MSDARDALLWVMEMGHDNHPDSHGRIADDFLAKHEVVLRSDLMSVATLRATVRQLVEGITYASYYRSGKAQVTFERAGREAFVRLLAMVSLEQEEDVVALQSPEEWAEAKGIVIVDPDGWRGDGAPALDTAITEAEFDRRAATSTIANRKEDGSW